MNTRHRLARQPALISSKHSSTAIRSNVTHAPDPDTHTHRQRRGLCSQSLPQYRVRGGNFPPRRRRASEPRKLLVRLCRVAFHHPRLDRHHSQHIAFGCCGNIFCRLHTGSTAVVCGFVFCQRYGKGCGGSLFMLWVDRWGGEGGDGRGSGEEFGYRLGGEEKGWGLLWMPEGEGAFAEIGTEFDLYADFDERSNPTGGRGESGPRSADNAGAEGDPWNCWREGEAGDHVDNNESS